MNTILPQTKPTIQITIAYARAFPILCGILRSQIPRRSRQCRVKDLRRTRKIVVRVIVLVLALLIGGVLYDLYFPRTTHMREFDPDEVARLETAMWRSYYDKQRLRLFNELSELLRTQYHMPLIRSNSTAYYAANDAFVFKQGKERTDYEQALPDLLKFYSA